jgi:hypothetical protein
MSKKGIKHTIHKAPPLTREDEQVLAWFRDKLASGPEQWDDFTYGELETRLKTSLNATLAVIEELAARSSLESAALLFRLHNLFKEKIIRKAINRALFKLKRKGVHFDEREYRVQEASIIREIEKKEPYGMVSAIDGRGDRLVFLVLPQRPRGWMVGGGIIGDESGMGNVFLSEMSRSETKSFFNEWKSLAPFHLVQTEARHSCSLLLECQTQMKRRDKEPPEAFLEMRPLMERHCSPLARPIIYEFLDEQDILNRSGLRVQIESLFAIRPFDTWVVEKETLQPYQNKIAEIEVGPIILTPVQKGQLIQEIYRKAAAEIFPAERREIIRRRLEESSYVLLKEGLEEEARIALAAALDIPQELSPLRESEFLLKWINRSFERGQEKAEPLGTQKAGESPVITL